MTQMIEITRGERAHGREFHVEPLAIKELREQREHVGGTLDPEEILKLRQQ